MIKNTLVVNLFSGPGAGKSTAAAGIFSNLKCRSIECELVQEFAKDLVWEKRHFTFNNQIYIFGEQHHRVFKLIGQVDVIITDSPTVLGVIYDSEKRSSLETLIIEEFKKLNSYNVFLRRYKSYNPNGRNQTEKEAVTVDEQILTVLNKHDIPFELGTGSKDGIEIISNKIVDELLPRMLTRIEAPPANFAVSASYLSSDLADWNSMS